MDKRELIALTLLKGQGVGNSFIKKNLDTLRHAPSIVEGVLKFIPEFDVETYTEKCLPQTERIIQECAEKAYSIVCIGDTDYPSSLTEIGDPPAVLYMKGNRNLLDRAVAVIGTRHSTPLGEKIAEKIGTYYSRSYSICNGLAEGIDKHAIYHNGSVLPNVIGVISGGLNFENTCSKSCAETIKDVLAAGGLIISEFPPYQKEDQFAGSKVSRVQAGLSQALILVQSSITGGSKYTLKAFSKLNRALGVVHFPSHEEYSSDVFGANRAIIEKGLEGVAEFIGLKTSKGLSFSKIMKIEGAADYPLLLTPEEVSKNTLF